MPTENALAASVKQKSKQIQTENGLAYRDLNKNGRLDIYEDPRQPIAARVEDLLSQMTLAEKAGMLFIDGVRMNPDGSIEDKSDEQAFTGFGDPVKNKLIDLKMNHFNIWQIPGARPLAAWYNNVQQLAEQSRLGIPVTLASDPRNHLGKNVVSMAVEDFSQWCETTGFGAIDDPELVRQFAEIAREEYLAVGIRVALHPQIDLATEPRWPRISGTFGEDAEISARLVKAYIAGFQGPELGPHSVACMTKHWPGGGPQKDGLDPHFEFQQGQIYPGDNFDYHLIPFEAAIEAGTASMMPYYGIPTGQTDEDVAMSYNKTIITTLLREKYGYNDVVCTDWGLITDLHMGDVLWPARAWGVEHLSEAERVLKVLDAGVDQFGGESCPHLVLELVESGKLTETRIDQSVRRLLKQKFELGLFDNPFVDEARVPEIFGNAQSAAAGLASQSRAMTLLKNSDDVLPLTGQPKIYVQNMAADVAANYAQVVESPEAADFAILRLDTPWVPVDTKNQFALGFHHGDLDFKEEAKAEILALCAKVPTIVVIYLDRPAVIPEISAAAHALLADFGASDTAVLNTLFGKAQPEGKLPFELPSSMAAVRAQRTDVPRDSKDPLYPFGFGLRY
ncbi:MAG: glycoside hydrolase family 3 C-terminal domain-containing protein [Ardenticatenaceae bacterium]|nr:glycoside hydrolase family 3 C-terminal domain-containing protein [Ardenticatenaceae bacterium]